MTSPKALRRMSLQSGTPSKAPALNSSARQTTLRAYGSTHLSSTAHQAPFETTGSRTASRGRPVAPNHRSQLPDPGTRLSRVTPIGSPNGERHLTSRFVVLARSPATPQWDRTKKVKQSHGLNRLTTISARRLTCYHGPTQMHVKARPWSRTSHPNSPPPQFRGTGPARRRDPRR